MVIVADYNRVECNAGQYAAGPRLQLRRLAAHSDEAGPPTVHSQYFGFPTVADFLGLTRAPQQPLRVSSLYDPAHPAISSYAGYVDGRLDRYMIVNLNTWNVTETGTRPSRHLDLDVPYDGVSGAEVRRLTRPGTDATAAQMSWAGTRYTAANPKGESVGPVTEQVEVRNRKAVVEVKASEAALVMLKR